MLEHPDFAVVVKASLHPPAPWIWEIRRAGRKSPIERSVAGFGTATEAGLAGTKALRLLLSEYRD
jgi:hypothetical protein